MTALVLVAEHDPAVAELQRRSLVRAGHEVRVEPEPGRAPDTAARLRPHAVVLDLSAAAHPADLYRRTAEACRPAPVIAVSGDPKTPGGRGAPRLPRPFAPRALVAAVAEALRSGAAGPADGPLRAGALTLDPARRTASAGGAPVALTATEFDLLAFLVGNPGRVFTREQLLAAVWGPAADTGSRTVDVHIAQLRAKIGTTGPIRTVRGIGYVLDP
ncbi:response regulator transcription factor [Actinomadura kijaniata]|uniref:response regulator transcription factor n=1 Tax=Actinomadura kijaniata TaxID=46161 RepID=UPI003F1C6BB2